MAGDHEPSDADLEFQKGEEGGYCAEIDWRIATGDTGVQVPPRARIPSEFAQFSGGLTSLLLYALFTAIGLYHVQSD